MRTTFIDGKRRSSLSLKSRRRIVAVDERRLEEAKKPIIPKNTEKATAWAFRLFNQWLVEHNDVAETKCPPDMLLTKDPDVLAHWLCVFISEIRKTDGGEYTPRSLSQTRGDVEENQTILKGMNFHDMEGCTINISFHTK